MTAVLFVCLGNICRSPAAEGVLKEMVSSNTKVASAGLGDWHEGQLPDERMRKAALRRDIVLTMRAQQIQEKHFEEFDLILGATREICDELVSLASHPEQKAKVKLMTAFSPTYKDQDVPDPYYKGTQDFELVLDILEDACEGLLEHLRKAL
jgi:protein-tyrosine phosphatase